MKLIVNADDFGLSKAVNQGILESYQNGIVRSTTLMAGMSAFDDAVHIAKKNPDLKVGVHLTLTVGRPIVEGHKTIVDPDGNFLRQGVLLASLDKISLDEVHTEFTAQILKALHAGLAVTHLDGHHHCHSFGTIQKITVDLCKKFKLACRHIDDEHMKILKENDIKSTEYFTASFYDENVTEENLIQLIMGCKMNSLEVMCHPAYIDQTLYQTTGYSMKRIEELSILTSEKIKNFILDHGIELCGFNQL